jgi:hypothetical protein
VSTPARYLPARWRAVLPVDFDDTQGIAFDLDDGQIVRLSIDAESALALVTLIQRYRSGDPRFQSPSSSGSPSVDGSMPDEGQKV